MVGPPSTGLINHVLASRCRMKLLAFVLLAVAATASAQNLRNGYLGPVDVRGKVCDFMHTETVFVTETAVKEVLTTARFTQTAAVYSTITQYTRFTQTELHTKNIVASTTSEVIAVITTTDTLIQMSPLPPATSTVYETTLTTTTLRNVDFVTVLQTTTESVRHTITATINIFERDERVAYKTIDVTLRPSTILTHGINRQVVRIANDVVGPASTIQLTVTNTQLTTTTEIVVPPPVHSTSVSVGTSIKSLTSTRTTTVFSTVVQPHTVTNFVKIESLISTLTSTFVQTSYADIVQTNSVTLKSTNHITRTSYISTTVLQMVSTTTTRTITQTETAAVVKTLKPSTTTETRIQYSTQKIQQTETRFYRPSPRTETATVTKSCGIDVQGPIGYEYAPGQTATISPSRF